MASLLTRLLTLPFTLVSMVFHRIFRGLPYLRLSTSSGSSITDGDDDGVHITDPRAASEYFVRMLKTHAHSTETGESVDAIIDSHLWYTAGGYEAALRHAKENHKILMVVLVSKEHDDNAAFMQSTLCTSQMRDLYRTHKEHFVLWGGDVCVSRDAHIAASILQAMTFPCIAFLSMQPVQPSRLTGSTPSTSSARMAVFSRLETLQHTTIRHLSEHITETVLPRLLPFLQRLRSQQQERDVQRRLRDEQDRAYAEAGKRDLDRVRAKEAELRQKTEQEDRKRAELAAKEQEKRNRDMWRRLTAAGFGPEPSDREPGSVKLVIRLPDGKRLVRRFGSNEAAARLWHLVECEAHGYPVTSPKSASAAVDLPSSYKPDLSFTLASTFPRRILTVANADGKTIGDLIDDGVLDKQVASLIVEGLNSRPSTSAHGADVEDEVLTEEED